MRAVDQHDLRARLQARVLERLSPERTRRATLFERLTVSRLSWDQIVKLNRFLETVGKIATGVWCGFVVAVILGFDARTALERVLHAGKPLEGLLGLTLLLITLIFLLARSSIGFARWRLQRELWRRDVAHATKQATAPGAPRE